LASKQITVSAAVTAGLLAVTTLAGCGGDLVSTGPTTGAAAKSTTTPTPGASVPATGSPTAPGSLSAAPHNEADVTFANRMIPHNIQSLATTQIVASKATKEQVKVFAAGMSKNRLPEIESLSRSLTSWGQPIPNGMLSTGQSAIGISREDLNMLSSTNGAAFDGLWLNLMVRHEENALKMAESEVAQGKDASSKALAQMVLKDRRTAIAEMRRLLAA
jgi:uncharacterized protein (DUF305 family)